MPLSGTTLGRYALRRKLAVGGMAEVWEAFDETLHRTVAVKVIRESISSSADFTERFTREARLAAGLEHPNILPVYDFGREGETAYLVMPLLPGGSLKDTIRDARGPLPPEVALEYLACIASAVDHAHTKGVLHRDVKPANVLMDQTGGLLLADFGLAKHAAGAAGLTQTGIVLGTPLYMSPEQAMGKALDARSDQYAIGIVAVELLTGAVPFNADSPLVLLNMHLQAPPPSLSARNPDLPVAVDAVVARALAKKPDERFGSCSEFVAALAEALSVHVPKTRSRLSSMSLVRMAAPLDESPTVKEALPEAAETATGLPASGASARPVVEAGSPRSSGAPSGTGRTLSPPPLPLGSSGSTAVPPPPRQRLSKGIAGVLLAVAIGVGIYIVQQRSGVTGPAASGASPLSPTRPGPGVPVERPDEPPSEKAPSGRYTLDGRGVRVVEVTLPYRPNERVPVKIQIDNAVIDSFEIRDAPKRRDFEKAERDRSDTYRVKLVYTYTNRSAREYKCNYVATLVDAGGRALGADATQRSLNKYQVADTNGASLRTRTLSFRDAASVKLRFEVRRD